MIRKKRMSKGIAKILSGLLVFGMVAGLVPAVPGGTVHANAAEISGQDMTTEQQERLGVDKEKIDRQLEKAALAQKYQNQIASENNSDFDGYSAGAEPYEQILKEHKYKLNEKLWDRVDFGNIILNH